MIFWVVMLVIWFALVMTHTTASAVLGVGILLAAISALFGTNRIANRVMVVIFLVAAIWQIGADKPVLFTVSNAVGLDKFEYPPEIRNDKMARPRYDLRMALNPHGAWEEWLKNRLPCSTDFSLAGDIEEEYNDWLKGKEDTETKWVKWAEDAFERQIQEMCFSKNMQKYLIARHMKYHGCTEEELLTSGRNVLESYMKSQVKQ